MHYAKHLAVMATAFQTPTDLPTFPAMPWFTGYEMTPEEVIEFVAGLINGFVGHDDLPELQKCMTDAKTLAPEIEDVINDFKSGDPQKIIAGIEEIGTIIGQLPGDLANCKDIQDDLKRIETWAKIFEHPE